MTSQSQFGGILPMMRLTLVIAGILQFVACADARATQECDIMLADSTIPNGGYGVFTTKDIAKGDRIGPPSIGIVLLDVHIDDHFSGLFGERGRIKPLHLRNVTVAGHAAPLNSPLNDYLWPSQSVGGSTEAQEAMLFLPGIASMANHHSYLENVMPSGLTRDGDATPSAVLGSETAYHGFTMIAKRDIQAGEELFVDRTILSSIPESRNSISLADFLQHQSHPHAMFAKSTYQRADTLVRSFVDSDLELTQAQWMDVLRRTKRDLLRNEPLVAMLLPSTQQDLQMAHAEGTARSNLLRRSLEDIQSQGKCMDNIREGPTRTNTPEQKQQQHQPEQEAQNQPKRGAFATRDLQTGQLVTPAPLLPVFDAQSIFKAKQQLLVTDNDIEDELPDTNPMQLFLNYCFGHHEQNQLRLCPTTNLALINHSKQRANAKLVWMPSSSNINGRQHQGQVVTEDLEALKFDIVDLSTYNTPVAFDVVATREIAEGEEIFIDYGDEWERAFQQHTDATSKRVAMHKPNPSDQWNLENRTLSMSYELLDNPITYECDLYPFIKEYPSNVIPQIEEFSANVAMDAANWEPDHLSWYTDDKNRQIRMYPCDVERPSNPSIPTFTITVYAKHLKDNRIIRRYKNCPRDRIFYVPRAYSSDQHQPWAFRHHIPISDAMFPLHWRDDYTTAESWRLGVTAVSNDSVEDAEKLYEKSLRSVPCGAYIAPSTIPNAGFGMYTAVDVPAGNLPIASYHPGLMTADTSGLGQKFSWIMKDYVWSGHTANYPLEMGKDLSAALFSVLFGSLTNCHPGINNIQLKPPIHHPTLDRQTDPGAGAFSDYVANAHISIHPIPAGRELFTSYGDSWFRVRDDFKDVPLLNDFQAADLIYAMYWSLRQFGNASVSDAGIEELMQVVRTTVVSDLRVKSALGLATTVSKLEEIVAINGTAPSTSAVRSREWFEENGQCLDHIFVKQSTIEQAGRGAFARRFIPKGSTIITAPLLPAFGEQPYKFDGPNVPDHANPKELLYNYMMGHNESSVHFIPSTHAIAINHKSNRQVTQSQQTTNALNDNKAGPNAEMQWATWNKKSTYFLNLPLEDLAKQKYSTVVMDFVATRDIEADEEIFMDYGQAWEDAWNDHVAKWQNPCAEINGPCYKSSKVIFDMNLPENRFNPEIHEWSEDHYTRCAMHQSSEYEDAEMIFIAQRGSQAAQLDRTPKGKVTLAYEGIAWQHEGFELAQLVGRQSLPCKVISAHKANRTFDVVIMHLNRNQNIDAKILSRIRSFRGSDLSFVAKPLRSDMFDKRAFRHDIEIPDELFPELWRDLAR